MKVIKNKLKEIKLQNNEKEKEDILLNTINFTDNLNLLTSNLPESNYNEKSVYIHRRRYSDNGNMINKLLPPIELESNISSENLYNQNLINYEFNR